MTRDMDLVRKILVGVEARNDPFSFEELVIDGHEPAEVSGHLEMLAEAGYVEVTDLTTMGTSYRKLCPKRLTWAGHEFLDSVRNESVWIDVKKKITSQGGALPLEIIKALAIAALKGHLGLPG